MGDARTFSSGIPEQLGDFRLLERLGAGGMGVVFRARDEVLDREVALKLILPEHLYFEEARERFRREVEAAAKLQHAGIVPVYSIGEEGGLPFFAMELVEGASLAAVIERLRGREPSELTGADLRQAILAATRRFDGHDSSTADSGVFGGTWVQACCRLAQQVADALHHAHERGVLHRDVKPSNILVTRSGRAMLVDFGLASTDASNRITRTGSQAGSMPYLPPERIRSGLAEADRRGDVYALGVSLYELLTLRVPFEGKTPHELFAAISSGACAPVRSLNVAVPWDASVVCATAMERDPERRYASADSMARDLRNLLELRPIEARPAGPALRLKRWIQRNPTLSVAAALGFLLIVVAPSVAWWRIRSERDKAVAELVARQGMLDFLIELFRAANPDASRENVTIDELVDEGAKRIQTALLDQPKARASLMLNFAQMESTLGRPRKALELSEQALALVGETSGEESEMATLARHVMGIAYTNMGEFDRAREMLERVLAERAERADSRELPTAQIEIDLAKLDFQQGRVREARERLLAIEPAVRGEHSDDLGAWLTAMAEIERTLGEGALAERFHREACEYQAAKWGESSLAYAAQLGNLAVVVLEAGRASDALQMFERVRSIRAEQAHLESMEDARLSFNLANAYNKLGRLEDCATEFARALAIAKRLNGESPSTARAAAGMGAALFKSGRLEEAERALREALELNRQFLPERGLQSIEAPLWLARTLAKRGANDEAAELFADVLRRIEGDPGTRAELRSKIEGECADVLEALGRGDEAREHRERGERALQSTP